MVGTSMDSIELLDKQSSQNGSCEFYSLQLAKGITIGNIGMKGEWEKIQCEYTNTLKIIYSKKISINTFQSHNNGSADFPGW